MESTDTTTLKRTHLYDKHMAMQAKMVCFAGYEMPVSYPPGILKEHLHTRTKAGLFDVSHMGQCFLSSQDGTFARAAKALERLVPADIQNLTPGQQRYSQLLTPSGGILDDLMISRLAFEGQQHKLYLVVNAGCKQADYAHIRNYLPDDVKLDIADEHLSLIALQGPKAASILGLLNPVVQQLDFMSGVSLKLTDTIWARVSRSGYSGEDGYEISVKHAQIEALTELLCSYPDVEMVGLGARDSLRLEAGLCLYGHDIDQTSSPIEAGLQWSIPKHRRSEGDFLGAERIQYELAHKPIRRLVGLMPEGRTPAREQTPVHSPQGEPIGHITSGGFSPSLSRPIAMGYVSLAYAKPGTKVNLIVRNKAHPARIVKMPFVPHNYYKPV